MKTKGFMRQDKRKNNELREIKVTPDFVQCAEGSVLIEIGRTRVLCNATIEDNIPGWLKGQGQGWITAEYNLLPRSTDTRVQRERKSVSGRTQEIQRLIGRSLRAVADLKALGERSIVVDCDVIEADGGTRTASVVGGFIALGMALNKLKTAGELPSQVLRHYVTAVSVGILEGVPILDLCYSEDSAAQVDMNVVFADAQNLIEIQGTGEKATFSRAELNQLLDLAEIGCLQLLEVQKGLVGELP
jgi:ribonuclease PH